MERMPVVNVEALRAEDEAERQKDRPRPPRFGKALDVGLGLSTAGRWTPLPDTSGRLWRMRVNSRGAHSINLIFDRFHLPPGGTLFIYNEDRSAVLGAFTEANNKPHGRFSTLPVEGSVITLEYYEPESRRGETDLRISTVVHAYRDMFPEESGGISSKDFGDSDSACQVNVNCPDGASWQDEKRSVAMVILGDGTRWCTGSLINNEREDLTPYFLSANHCKTEDYTTAGVSDWVFWFNYESASCSNPSSEPGYDGISGASLKANKSDSDFLLLELSSAPPANYDPYYAGWSASGNFFNSSVGIHHPDGDIKKISFDNQSPNQVDYITSATNSHWEVSWNKGITAVGSSGSPLFDQDGQIVGQLHGGNSFCGEESSDPDFYGKFSMSWDRGNNSSSRLKDWLDPDNTGIHTLDGLEGPFTAEVNGPDWRAPGNSGTWTAEPPGEPGNYSYRWYLDDDGDGSGGFTDTGVTSRSYSRSDNGDFSLEVEIDRDTQSDDPFQYVDVGAPAVPENFYLTNTGQPGEYVHMQWEAAPGADSYDIYRDRTDEYGGYQKIGNVSTTTNWTDYDTKVGGYSSTEGASYYVKALNQYGTSAASGSDGGPIEGKSSRYAANEKNNAVPEAFSLSSSVPNPARNEATIRYDLPEATPVTLVVYDVMGRTVARLVDRTVGPGRHRATLEASTLPSGVYFYRFRAGEAFAKTHRMVVIR